MSEYYEDKLSGMRLMRCYEIASPRVRQYLEAEIRHALSRLGEEDRVLELGCGYGRVATRLAEVAREVIGVDTAHDSLKLAGHLNAGNDRLEFMPMDATDLRFADGEFDAVVCVQNGICAFGVDHSELVREALRVVRPGGIALFSTYSDRFWPHRLAWFEAQADEGLLGPIDYAATGDGTIVCTDGFSAGRLTPEDLEALCAGLGLEARITEVDGSSVFCEIEETGR